MDEHRTLRAIWRFSTELRGAAFNIEFVALANHRKAIRDEIARYAQQFRQMQLEAIAVILDELGVSPEAFPPVIVLLAMTGVTQVMALEAALGVTDGHDEMMMFVDSWLDGAEPDRAEGVHS